MHTFPRHKLNGGHVSTCHNTTALSSKETAQILMSSKITRTVFIRVAFYFLNSPTKCQYLNIKCLYYCNIVGVYDMLSSDNLGFGLN